MSLTITSAQWANADQTAAVINTQEMGAVAISQIDRPQAWADFQAWISGGGSVSALPGPSAAEQRTSAFIADTSRADMIDKLMNATLTQIDTYVDNNVTGTTVTILRNECRVLFKKLIKAVALNVQR